MKYLLLLLYLQNYHFFISFFCLFFTVNFWPPLATAKIFIDLEIFIPDAQPKFSPNFGNKIFYLALFIGGGLLATFLVLYFDYFIILGKLCSVQKVYPFYHNILI